MPRPDSSLSARFDGQASDFDERAGLPVGVRAQVADAILAIADLPDGSRVLDVGAGTGEVGVELLARGVGYLALDASEAMLSVFRGKALTAGFTPELRVGDARDRWPVEDASIGLVFGSRSLHWLSPGHVERESLRVASPAGCTILIGRVERRDESPRARLRRRMRDLLEESGHAGRSGGASSRAIVGRLVASGAKPVPARVAAVWNVRFSPRSVLEAWRRKPGLGGADVPAELKDAVLARTEAFAVETFGDIDVPTETEECYTLEGAMLAGPRER
jgi:SAM-dependent methyltransferase